MTDTIDKKIAVDTLITDLDDTLVPFRKAFVSYAKTMVEEISKASGLPKSKVISGFNKLYHKNGVFQFEDAINSHRHLKRKFPGEDLRERFAPQIEKAQKVHKDIMKADKETLKSLRDLKNQGVKLVLYTAGPANFTIDKLEQAGLTGVFDRIYAVEDTPPNVSKKKTREKHPSKEWGKVTELPRFPKTKTEALEKIIDDVYKNQPYAKDRIAMMGDHPLQDIKMAQQVGVKTVMVTGFRAEELSKEDCDFLSKMLHKPFSLKAKISKSATVRPNSRWGRKKLKPDASIEKAAEISKILKPADNAIIRNFIKNRYGSRYE